MAVTIRDVASAAGVSVATVSRVLSGSRPVKAEAARAVLAASERLGYRTNYLARALRRQTTQTIGMVVPQIANPFFPWLVQAVERGLHSRGHALLLCDSADDPDTESNRITALLDRRVDGLVVIPCNTMRSTSIVKKANHRVPVVQLDRRIADSSVSSVSADNFAGIEAVIGHLERTGRRRLAFVGADPSMSTASERLDAYAAASARLEPSNPKRVVLGDFSLAWGREAVDHLLATGPLPEALVCANDLIAMGTIQRLRSVGANVPDDVAVSGFDDIGFAEVCEPSLTSLRQPGDELGSESVRLLLAHLAGANSTPQHVRLVPKLLKRHSTAMSGHDPSD